MKKATREQTKSHNKTLILNTIYNNSEISRASVARKTGLTRSTVSDIVAEFIEEGLVAEIGQGQSAGGKPPILLTVIEEARHIIGIDLASSEFRGALIDLRGGIKDRINLPINNLSGEEALSLVYQLIDKLLELNSVPILGIGIGTPGLMDAERGIVRNAVNLDWHDLPLADLLRERYQLPVFIANDSQVSALAEFTFGESRGIPNLLLIKVGRGVGAGIVLNQQLYYGDGFGAGEIGHVKVDPNGELCRCGNYGCLETKISSRAIQREAQKLAEKNASSIINQLVDTSEAITTEVVLEAFEKGDADVGAIIEQVGKDLGNVLAYLVSLLNIERVVVAGSVSTFGEGVSDPIKKQLQSNTLAAISQNVEIEISNLGEEIVMLGAAGMVLQNELGIL
ncbi:MAG: ROK family transcriptional regulator [Anaerolineales bacterium]|jgi:glucokinase-like ROK family protein